MVLYVKIFDRYLFKGKAMEEILQNLNKEQRLPAETASGAVLVTAGAGSGKTRMLTHRIAHLVFDLNVPKYNILAITFTNKAANEMKERLETMLGDVSQMWICTFHAMCSRILRRDAEQIGYTSNFSIYTDVEKERTIKRVLEDKNTDLSADTIGWHISNAKNHLMDPDEYSKYIMDPRKRDVIIKCFKQYEAELKHNNALDFDDLLNKTYELLMTKPNVLNYYQDKFKYIHVDEFQDTNKAQYELIKLLSAKYGNIFVVGDEDQCIYSWRGADVTNVSSFVKDFSGAKVFKLEQNYRSTKKILEAANKLIKRNQNRLEKLLWTENGEGTKVEFFTTYNESEEAEYVAETLKNLVNYSGYKYSDCAVLMRVNSLSRNIEEKFITYGIPYKVYGGFKFFERKEIKDVIAYLRLIHNPFDDEATRRMLAFPKRGIGDMTVAQIEASANEIGISMYDFIVGNYAENKLSKKLENVKEMLLDLKEKSKNMSLYDFVEYAINTVDFKGAIGDKTDEDHNKQMNIDDFLLSVKEFADANEGATLEDYLQSITLMRDVDSLDQNEDYASVITVHAAKGLEFKVVFIVGLNDGLFPLSRAINSEDENELEEERRLMYVAITRAKERLFLTRARTRFSFESKRTEYTLPSRFLKECIDDQSLNSQNGEIKRSTFDGGYMPRRYNEETDNLFNAASRSNIEKVSTNQTIKKTNLNFSAFKRGTKVKHPHFGNGVVTVEVTDFSAGFVTIKFDTVGIKTLSLKYANLEIIE